MQVPTIRGYPDSVVEGVSGLTPSERKSLMADFYLSSLIRSDGEMRHLYNAILTEFIRGQVKGEQATWGVRR